MHGMRVTSRVFTVGTSRPVWNRLRLQGRNSKATIFESTAVSNAPGGEIMARTPATNKPDFRNGFSIRDLDDGSMISGQADGEEVVLARRGDDFFAIGAHCTHYGGPLAEGLIVGDTVRCPWHHACFSLRNGEALRAPALDPVACWRVEKLGDKILVREKVSPPAPKHGTEGPSSVVI